MKMERLYCRSFCTNRGLLEQLILAAEETPQIATQAATTNQMKIMITKSKNQRSNIKSFIGTPLLEGYTRKIWKKLITR